MRNECTNYSFLIWTQTICFLLNLANFPGASNMGQYCGGILRARLPQLEHTHYHPHLTPYTPHHHHTYPPPPSLPPPLPPYSNPSPTSRNERGCGGLKLRGFGPPAPIHGNIKKNLEDQRFPDQDTHLPSGLGLVNLLSDFLIQLT